MATPSSGQRASTRPAAAVNQARQSGRLIGNSSETSGMEVMKEQPASTCKQAGNVIYSLTSHGHSGTVRVMGNSSDTSGTDVMHVMKKQPASTCEVDRDNSPLGSDGFKTRSAAHTRSCMDSQLRALGDLGQGVFWTSNA